MELTAWISSFCLYCGYVQGPPRPVRGTQMIWTLKANAIGSLQLINTELNWTEVHELSYIYQLSSVVKRLQGRPPRAGEPWTELKTVDLAASHCRLISIRDSTTQFPYTQCSVKEQDAQQCTIKHAMLAWVKINIRSAQLCTITIEVNVVTVQYGLCGLSKYFAMDMCTKIAYHQMAALSVLMINSTVSP